MRKTKFEAKRGGLSVATAALGLVICLAAMGAPHLAAAAETNMGGGLPYEGFLRNVTSSVSGPVAYTIALLGVAGAGGTLIFGGDLNGFLRAIILLVCFTGLLISAPALLSAISGAGAVVALAAPAIIGQLG